MVSKVAVYIVNGEKYKTLKEASKEASFLSANNKRVDILNADGSVKATYVNGKKADIVNGASKAIDAQTQRKFAVLLTSPDGITAFMTNIQGNLALYDNEFDALREALQCVNLYKSFNKEYSYRVVEKEIKI